ncbi:MAG: DUF1189 family protein [Alphaproteobacteria bacterium]|nr:DUF1189 family protein [Alphaproteobacteria bacterium]
MSAAEAWWRRALRLVRGAFHDVRAYREVASGSTASAVGVLACVAVLSWGLVAPRHAVNLRAFVAETEADLQALPAFRFEDGALVVSEPTPLSWTAADGTRVVFDPDGVSDEVEGAKVVFRARELEVAERGRGRRVVPYETFGDQAIDGARVQGWITVVAAIVVVLSPLVVLMALGGRLLGGVVTGAVVGALGRASLHEGFRASLLATCPTLLLAGVGQAVGWTPPGWSAVLWIGFLGYQGLAVHALRGRGEGDAAA